ncbi:MAG: hypothetical protein WC761_01670 [Candidatus Paceibacterota bacterium]|jgi:hypothetical protein
MSSVINVIAVAVFAFCVLFILVRLAIAGLRSAQRADDKHKISNFFGSYREPGDQQEIAKSKPIVPMFIGYHNDRWFDVAAATCWKRTWFQGIIDANDSIMWRTVDGTFITRPNTYGINGVSTKYLNEISNEGAFAWFASSKRFRSQTPPELIECMKDARR